MNWLKRVILSLTILFIHQHLNAQANSFNAGIAPTAIAKEFEEAPAVILLDSGMYTVTTGFDLLFQHSQQIKILRKEGLPYANFEIPFAKNDSLVSFSGKVISAANGQQDSINIETRDFEIVTNAIGDQVAKLRLDQVQVGDIISFEYSLRLAGLDNINNWYFQNDIPVQKSTITLKIPSFIFYYKFLEGQLNLGESKRTIVSGKLGEDTYKFQLEIFTMSNIPAYIAEADVPGEDYFISKLTLHLAEQTLPGQPTKYFLPSTYEDLSYNWSADPYFQQIEKYSSYLTEKIDQIYHSEFSNEKNIRSLYFFIRNNFTTDNSLYDDDLYDTFKRRAGNEQQINMLLAKMLNQAGFKAYLLAISTIDNRPIYPSNPYFALFNKFVVMVRDYSNVYYLDASDPNLLFNMLSPNSVNGSGLVISKVNNGLIPLEYLFDDREATGVQVKLTDTATMVVDYQNTRSGYSLYSFDTKYLENYKSYNDYLIETIFNNPTWQISYHDMKEVFDENKVVEESLKFVQPLKVNSGTINIPTSINNDFYDNPYPSSERQNPITLYTPISRKGKYTFSIPKSYSIQKTPVDMSVALPEEAGTFRYAVSRNGQKVEISYYLDVNKVIFLSSEYNHLSEFFAKVSQAFQQEIIVKKNQ